MDTDHKLLGVIKLRNLAVAPVHLQQMLLYIQGNDTDHYIQTSPWNAADWYTEPLFNSTRGLIPHDVVLCHKIHGWMKGWIPGCLPDRLITLWNCWMIIRMVLHNKVLLITPRFCDMMLCEIHGGDIRITKIQSHAKNCMYQSGMNTDM